MDILKTFGPLIGSIAPTIATALGGPIAGMAIKALSGALFGHEDGTEEDIMTALANPTGDQLTALKKIDADFKIQMKQLDIDLVRITVDDRKSARDMQVVTKSWLVPTLATMIIAAFIAVTFATLMGYAKIESALAGTLVGYISAKAELVLSFYFGSSAGSEKKDEMLYKSTPGS